MIKKTFLRPVLIFGLIAMLFAACDKGFSEIGTDLVGDDHFGFSVDSSSTVKAYNQKLGPIASNNLAINPLGFYRNPAFGVTQANFVTQLELSTINPTFNNTDHTLYVHQPSVDSVVMDIPYFKTLKTTNSDGTKVYELDSIYGATPYDQTTATDNAKFSLKVYESGYYLRDLDPGQALVEQQLFYTDENSTIDGYKGIQLNTAPHADPPTGQEGTHNADGRENDSFYFDQREHALTTYKSDGVTKITPSPRSVPSMRIHLDTLFFNNKIIKASSGQLANNSVFKNYFRGIYFKTDHGINAGDGNIATLNFKAGKITIYYKEDLITPDNVNTPSVNEYKVDRVSKSFALNLTGNTISLLTNSSENTDYLTAANSSQEASRLYLKGGEGSISYIDLFGSTDLKGYTLNPAFNESIPISPTNPKYIVNNIPNGISDEIDNIKINGWLINEANLTFFIDKSVMSNSPGGIGQPVEPNRIFLYDMTHKKALIDYAYDNTSNSVYPKFGKYIHDGIIQIKDVGDGQGKRGQKYRVRITNYVRNLVKNDSTNVRLGLSVTESISNTGLSKLRTPNSYFVSAPTMSVMNQLGTVLYGTSPIVPEDKKLKLRIYYTKPN